MPVSDRFRVDRKTSKEKARIKSDARPSLRRIIVLVLPLRARRFIARQNNVMNRRTVFTGIGALASPNTIDRLVEERAIGKNRAGAEIQLAGTTKEDGALPVRPPVHHWSYTLYLM
jgi:hypothetical protein